MPNISVAGRVVEIERQCSKCPVRTDKLAAINDGMMVCRKCWDAIFLPLGIMKPFVPSVLSLPVLEFLEEWPRVRFLPEEARCGRLRTERAYSRNRRVLFLWLERRSAELEVCGWRVRGRKVVRRVAEITHEISRDR